MGPKPESNVRARFAQRLRAARIPRGFKTARSFASALGIDENRYTRYERAEVEPDLDMLMRICEMLGVMPNDLLCETPALDEGIGSGAGLRGFRERSAPFSGPEGADASPDGVKAIRWQLAEAVAVLRRGADTAQAAGALRPMLRLRETVSEYEQIERDPYAYLAKLAHEPLLSGLDAAQEVELDRLASELIGALRG